MGSCVYVWEDRRHDGRGPSFAAFVSPAGRLRPHAPFTIAAMYQPLRPSRSEHLPLRNLRYHVRQWGTPTPGKPPLVLVHGWMDVSASYQFMVDAFSEAFMQGRHIIAPDWRGYGLTTGDPVDCYWFPDYLADLDFLLDHYAGDQPVDLVGHSMGGHVVMQYAGVRPQRIRRLVNLEGFGMPEYRGDEVPKRLARWFDELKTFHRGETRLKPYDDADGVAQRLMRTNPRLQRDATGQGKAAWLASQWATEKAPGRWEILGDAAHRIINPDLARLDEVLALYAGITAPLLAVEATDNELKRWNGGRYALAQYHERLRSVPDHRIVVVQDAGHMLHHDQPEQLAGLLENFLR